MSVYEDVPDDEARVLLGEYFHTAFRKGADGGGSHEVWTAIKKCTTYNDALHWLMYALRESGYKLVKAPVLTEEK